MTFRASTIARRKGDSVFRQRSRCRRFHSWRRRATGNQGDGLACESAGLVERAATSAIAVRESSTLIVQQPRRFAPGPGDL